VIARSHGLGPDGRHGGAHRLRLASYARLIRGTSFRFANGISRWRRAPSGQRPAHPGRPHSPNAIFLVYASMDIGSYVLNFAALSFLGMGAEVGYADWGQMISFARNWISSLGQYPYIVVYPGMAILLFVLGWNLLGDAFRDIIDPRLRGSR
jgi:peptide/nickel transport system permease protein